MITEETMHKVAKLSLRAILDRLSERAREEVREDFCKQHCGKVPSGELCPEARRVYKRFLTLQFENYSRFN